MRRAVTWPARLGLAGALVVVAACHAPHRLPGSGSCAAPGLVVRWRAAPLRVDVEHGRRIASMYVLRGDRLRVLHASAALATAEYEHRAGRWHLVHGFRFACRREGQACRDAFAHTEGWSANVAEAGSDRSFEVDAALAPPGARFTVVSLDPQTAATAPDVRACPGITGDIVGPSLQAGEPPEVLDVDSRDWPSVPG